jgi:hypothetical protein
MCRCRGDTAEIRGAAVADLGEEGISSASGRTAQAGPALSDAAGAPCWPASDEAKELWIGRRLFAMPLAAVRVMPVRIRRKDVRGLPN